ncbi:MAG: hypothetical protein Q4A55_00140 [Aerococcus sp.]|nr:hypothetical protein [Aerococcus sp.]
MEQEAKPTLKRVDAHDNVWDCYTLIDTARHMVDHVAEQLDDSKQCEDLTLASQTLEMALRNLDETGDAILDLMHYRVTH